MRDLSEKQSRYLRDDVPIRLGNLASNLAHISSFAKGSRNPTAVERLLDESRFFIEWTAAETELDTAAELVEMQVPYPLRQNLCSLHTYSAPLMRCKCCFYVRIR